MPSNISASTIEMSDYLETVLSRWGKWYPIKLDNGARKGKAWHATRLYDVYMNPDGHFVTTNVSDRSSDALVLSSQDLISAARMNPRNIDHVVRGPTSITYDLFRDGRRIAPYRIPSMIWGDYQIEAYIPLFVVDRTDRMGYRRMNEVEMQIAIQGFEGRMARRLQEYRHPEMTVPTPEEDEDAAVAAAAERIRRRRDCGDEKEGAGRKRRRDEEADGPPAPKRERIDSSRENTDGATQRPADACSCPKTSRLNPAYKCIKHRSKA